ncbi:MAG: AraC family transcriptional regulator [Clostridia bacterium]|nr:AraC family transcriptional regulator [Clostridia bacterium]
MYIMDSEKIQGFSKNGYFFQRTNGRKLSNKLHAHTFYEILFVVSGSCIHETNNETQNLSIGTLVFISPMVSHKFLSQTENTDLIVISVVANELEKLFSLYELTAFSAAYFVLKLPIEKRQILVSLGENITFTESAEYIKQQRMILNQIFLFCLEAFNSKENIPPELAAVLDKMQDLSYAAEGIKMMLKTSGYSHSQICRLTKKYFGITPTEYINRIRMSHAYKLIVYGSYDYETICNMVGFESFSYFSKLIKEHFGCSPSKLRNGYKYIQKSSIDCENDF